MSSFGLTFNSWLATYDWETTHGHGIDYRQEGSCPYTILGFWGVGGADECGTTGPDEVILGCWRPDQITIWDGVWAAQTARVWLNGPAMNAFAFTEGEQTWVIAHELGHAMALAHHTWPDYPFCDTVMADGAGPCTDQVETSDVQVPRCIYPYTC